MDVAPDGSRDLRGNVAHPAARQHELVDVGSEVEGPRTHTPVVSLGETADPAADKEKAKAEAKKITDEATAEAKKTKEAAKKEADETTKKAKEEAKKHVEKGKEEAKTNAEKAKEEVTKAKE